MNKKISCILPVKGHQVYLKESIKSILNQTYSNFELIIIDNGNSNAVVKILNSFKKRDKRIKLVKMKKANLSEILNYGIKISSGKFIARQDADDLSHPERFNSQIKWFKNNRILCGINSFKTNKFGKIIGKINLPTSHNSILKKMYFLNPFVHSSVMFRKDVIGKKLKYDKYFKYAQDYNLWVKVFKKGIIGNINDQLHYLRIHNNTISVKNKVEQNKYFLLSAIKYYKKNKFNKNLNFSKSLDFEINSLNKDKNLKDYFNLLKFIYLDSPNDKNFVKFIDLKINIFIYNLTNKAFLLSVYRRLVRFVI